MAAWWSLALLALGLSTLMALVLVAARMPFLGLGSGFFRTALVLHVDLAVVVWFLAMAAGIWMVAYPVEGRLLGSLAWSGIGLAAGGVTLALAAPWWGGAVPVLANYVPIIDSPVFLTGLACFGLGVVLAAGTGLISYWRRPSPATGRAAWQWAAGGALLAFLVAVAVFLMAQPDNPIASFDDRVWGAGHVLQNVHILMLMAAWLHLGEVALAELGRRRRLVLLLVGMAGLAPLADLWLAATLPVGSSAYRQGFTEVMRWANWPAPLFLASLIAIGFRRQARRQALDMDEWGLLASMGLFLLGSLVGMTIRGESTVVPAHYHGTVGAVTLAYMLWARSWVSRFGLRLPAEGLWRWQPMIYALGIVLLVVGLAWSGWLGVPRKAPHAEVLMQGTGYWVAMGIAGIGGFFAMTGAGLFVFGWLESIWRKRSETCSTWERTGRGDTGEGKSAGVC